MNGLHFHRVLAFAFIVFMASCAGRQGCPDAEQSVSERFRPLDSLLTEMFPPDEPGAAVLIMEGDSIVFDRGYGRAVLPGVTGAGSVGESALQGVTGGGSVGESGFPGVTDGGSGVTAGFRAMSGGCDSSGTAVEGAGRAETARRGRAAAVRQTGRVVTARRGRDETVRRIDGDTFFNIASCSKQFTAVAVLQLAEQGLLSLDDPVSKHFPEYQDPIWDKVLVRHLLSHSSGVPDARGYLSREAKIAGNEDLALEYLPTVRQLNFEPGTQYEYINPTFVLLGRLVERISGEEFTSYVRKHIFDPAGMEHTLYFDRDRQELIPSMAHAYEYADVEDMPEERTAETDVPSDKDWYEYDYGEETFFATRPDGGIYTSTHEFVRWELALRSFTVLSEAMQTLAWTPHTLVSGSQFSDYQNRPGTWYGYGWFIEPGDGDDDFPVIYHTGDNGGFKALAARYPEKDALVLVFANRADWDRYALKTLIESYL